MARPAFIGICINRMSPRVLFDYRENSVDPLTRGGSEGFHGSPP